MSETRPVLGAGVAMKLAKICARLGSDHDGERAAAALLINKIMADNGIAWESLFGLAEQYIESPSGDDAMRLRYCLDRADHLDMADLRFCQSLGETVQRGRILTPGQREPLRRIFERAVESSAAALDEKRGRPSADRRSF